MKRKNENVEIALITGDDDVGAKSDEILSRQLDDVLSMEHYDDLILVSDGAWTKTNDPLLYASIMESIFPSRSVTIMSGFP